MKHLVFYSGGVGSYLAAKRVVAEFGTKDVELVFADTLIEDPSLYRFLEQSRERLGVRGTYLADGRDPWQIFYDRRFLGNSRIDPCSQVLKRDLLNKYRDRFSPQRVVVYIGIDWTEEHRFHRHAERAKPYVVRAPLCEPPLYDSKEAMFAELRADGLEMPKLYTLGFAHNNCGGFCIKAGIGQFKLLLEKRPELYAYHEQQEQNFRAFIGKNVSILKDRRGGTTKPLTLTTLRKRVEQEDLTSDEKLEFGGCGCAID